MIRKFFSIAAVSALTLLSGSCQKEELGGIDDSGAKVSFTVKTNDGLTKAISDASNIDILHWEIYPENVEAAAEPLAKGSVKDTDGNGEFTLDLSLILDQTYNFIFWAQADREEGKEHYDVSDLRRVGIKSYDDELANDESRAAFFAHKEIHVSGSIDETVTLYRPFSQLNLGTSTYDVSSLNLTSSLKVNHSEIKVYGIADTFNTIAGLGEGKQTVHFQKAVTPNGDRDATEKILEVNSTNYYWLGMNYLIVNGDSDNVKVDVTFHTTHGNVNLSIDNVPVKENFRTNIIGDLLTSEAIFKIVVDERFQQPDIIVGDEDGSTEGGEQPIPDFEISQEGDVITYTVYTPEGLEAWRQAAHQDALDDTDTKINLILGADITLEYIEGEANWTPVGTYEHPYDGYIDGAGHSISDMSIDTKDGPAGFIGAWTGEDGATAAANLTFRNVHIVSANNYGTGAVIGYGHKNFVIKNCHVKGGSVSGIGGGPCGGLFGGGFGGGFGNGSGSGFGGIAIGCTNSASVITSTITYYIGGIGGFGNAVNCTNTGTVTGSGYYIGGILGGSNGQVTGNKNTGKVTGGTYAGGIVGGIQDGTLENNSNYGDVYGTEDGTLGGIYGWLDGSTTQSNNIYECIIKVIVIDKDYTIKTEPEVTTYTVYTAEGLEIWRAAAHQDALDATSDKINLVLAADIELPAVEEGQSNWTPVGTSGKPYDGYIDGAGFTIKNLTINGGNNVGFIGAASYGETVVSNLKLDNVNINGGKNVGAVIGQVTDDGKIDNCHVLGGKVTGTGDNVGGLLGNGGAYGGATNSSNAADVSGVGKVGGISGAAYANNSVNTGNVTGTGDNVGGVFGSYTTLNAKFHGNKNFGAVTGRNKVGGIAGCGASYDSINEGKVSGNNYVAGINGDASICEGILRECINKGDVEGSYYVGGISGAGTRTSITQSINEGSVSGEQYVGGIAGVFRGRYNYTNVSLTDNRNSGNVTGLAYVGGLVGETTGTSYRNAITGNTNEGNVKGEDKVGGFVGYNKNATVTGNNNSGDIEGATNIGHFVGQQDDSYSPDTVTGNVSTGQLNILQNNDYTRTVDGTTVSYIVYTQKGFETWVAEAHKSVEEGYACNLTLETDIVLPVPAAGESNWTPIGTEPNRFKGDIDGKNHTITNLTVKESRAGMGFIGYISSGSIKNITLDKVDILQSTTSNYNHVAAIAGYAAVNIENCHVLSGTIVGLDDWVGGIAGSCSKTITGCTNYASVTGAEKGYNSNGYVGGIVGEGNVSNCDNYGAVIGYKRYTGGITGSGDATDCKNFADVTKGGNTNYTGGIIGSGNAIRCQNSGNVTGYHYVGGIIGRGAATNCINTGKVVGSRYVGGIAGYLSSRSVIDCDNSGDVSADSYHIGGIVGDCQNSTVSGCTNKGKVSSVASTAKYATSVGGIAGYVTGASSSITENINEADILGYRALGGIVGYLVNGTVSGNEHTGDVYWLDNPDGYNGLIVGLHEGGTVADDNVGTGTLAQQ